MERLQPQSAMLPLRYFVNFLAIATADLTPNFICVLLIRAENI